MHPESYPVVEAMARDLACQVEDLLKKQNLREDIRPEKYVTDKVGLPTINDIKSELEKPGRDPRQSFEVFSFAEGVHEMNDLEVGMKLPGVVTNVTNFGAFVDVGVHQDGLVHISHLADRFVKDPRQVVKVQDRVEVTVLDVDLARGRISLSMRKDPFADRQPSRPSGDGGRPAKKGRKKPPPKPEKQPFNNAMAKALEGLRRG